MHKLLRASSFVLLLASRQAFAQSTTVDFVVNASDGAKLGATYYSPGKPGPGILLLHQCNMDRRSWNGLGEALARGGVHVLTFDYRGYGSSPPASSRRHLESDIDAALAALVAQPGVDAARIAAGGASCGVNNAVELARRSNRIKALVLLSGPTTETGISYLRAHSGIPVFGAASAEEDFAVRSLRTVTGVSTNTSTMMKVVGKPGHGTPMFDADPAFLPLVAEWVVNVLR